MNAAEYLIDEVHKRPLLYDSSKDLSRCARAKERIWNEIASKLNCTPQECKKRWRILRDGYIKRKKILNENAKKGIEWRYFNKLKFLDERNVAPKNLKTSSISMENQPDSAVEAQNKDTFTDDINLYKEKKIATHFLSGEESLVRKRLGLDEDSTEYLIAEVRLYPFLYNSTTMGHARELAAKEIIWKQIAYQLNIKPEECKIRWRNLRDGYIKRKRRANVNAKKGIKTKIQWRYFKSLSFLDEYSLVLRSASKTSEHEQSTQGTDEDTFTDGDAFSLNGTNVTAPNLSNGYNSDLQTFEEVEILESLHHKSDNDRSTAKIDGIETFFLGLARQMKETGMPQSHISNISSRVYSMVFREIRAWFNMGQ